MDIENQPDNPKEIINPLIESMPTIKAAKSAETKVQVALRVRPFVQKEILDKDQKCTHCYCESKQVKTFSSIKVDIPSILNVQ